MSDEEVAALTAHWLLGRLSVLQATISHLAIAKDLDEDARRDLISRSRQVGVQMQESLEAMVRGLPPPLIDLSERPVGVTRPE